MSDYLTLAKKATEYIERTQPIIDKINEIKAEFAERATKVAEQLSEKGILDARRANEFVMKVAENPVQVWELVEKLISALPDDEFGRPATNKEANTNSNVCPFERAFFGNSISGLL